MSPDLDPPVRVLADARSLREGRGARFRLRDFGIVRDAFAVRWRGGVFAYLNTCRHEGFPLDFGDASFFDSTGNALECGHHGARYRPDTGACIDGPCAGGGLTRLAVEERDGALWCLGRAKSDAEGP